MSNKINENIDIKKLKEEIVSQIKEEQKDFMENIERKIEESIKLITETNKKFKENKELLDNTLSEKYFLEKIENLDKKTTKFNDTLLAHEIRISKNIDEINSLRTKYDKIILDNLLVPGQIGPSCAFKNLGQYLKNNIYEMKKMKEDNENIVSSYNDFKIRFETGSKNITGLIDNSVTRSNQYTDSRITDCISILENKLKGMSEKLMEMRMKNIQFQDKTKEDINIIKNNYEIKINEHGNKISQLNLIVEELNNVNLDEESIQKKLKKLKSKIKRITEFLLEFIDNYQPNNSINKPPQNVKTRRNSMVLGNEIGKLINNNNIENNIMSPRKNGKTETKINDIETMKKRELLFSVKKQRQSTNVYNNLNFKFKSNQKTNIKMKLLNISDTSSDNEEKKDKNNIKKNLNEIIEKNNFNDSKKNKNKSNISNKLDKGSKNKSNIKRKNEKNKSKIIKKENSNLNSFDSSDSNENNNSKEKDTIIETKNKSKYQSKKNNERIIIPSKTINRQEKYTYTFNNSKINNNSNFPSNNYELSNNSSNIRLKNNIHSRNTAISPNQYLNNPPNYFYRTQQEEKKEIIKEFFSKYDKSLIPENLSLIKNRGNLDLYNYSVSPPDNNHFLDTKYDEIYDPPLTKEFLFNNKNSSIPKLNNKHKLYLNNINETNNKKVGTDKKIYLNNNTNYNNKFVRNKKVELSNKFTNTYKNYYPENIKNAKMYSIDSTKKL